MLVCVRWLVSAFVYVCLPTECGLLVDQGLTTAAPAVFIKVYIAI